MLRLPEPPQLCREYRAQGIVNHSVFNIVLPWSQQDASLDWRWQVFQYKHNYVSWWESLLVQDIGPWQEDKSRLLNTRVAIGLAKTVSDLFVRGREGRSVSSYEQLWFLLLYLVSMCNLRMTTATHAISWLFNLSISLSFSLFLPHLAWFAAMLLHLIGALMAAYQCYCKLHISRKWGWLSSQLIARCVPKAYDCELEFPIL